MDLPAGSILPATSSASTMVALFARFAVIQDITERKQAEELLKSAMAKAEEGDRMLSALGAVLLIWLLR